MKTGTDHERNDRIEGMVMAAALATLCLLVALAVSTSMSAYSAESELRTDVPQPSHTAVGIETEETAAERQLLR